MDSLSTTFRDEIERFLAEAEMDATTFGKRAMNDPGFVFGIRKGRSPNLKTIDRVQAFIREHRRVAA